MSSTPISRTEFDRWLGISVAVAIVSILQFAYFCKQAMDVYPGGDYRFVSEKKRDMPGYDWRHNWLSDLGRDYTWSNRKNSRSAAYFNRSIIVLGLGLMAFFGLFHRSTDEASIVAWGMQVCGLLAGGGLIGIGLTPVDRHFVAHHVALILWVLPMPIMSILFAWACFRSSGVLGWAAGLIASLMSIVLVIAVFSYAFAGSPGGYVVMQKIVVGISIIWFLLLAMRVAMATIQTVTMGRREVVAMQAEEYSKRLQQGHLINRKKQPS